MTLYSAALAAALLIPSLAFATNGYFQHGFGTGNKGMAGSGVAHPKSALQAATNPAGMVHVGNRADLGIQLFAPIREYEVESMHPSGFYNFLGVFGPTQPPSFFPSNTPYDEKSSSNLFLIPSFGYNHMINDRTSIGVSVYGNGGMNTSWDANANNGFGTYFGDFLPDGGGTGVNLMQLFIAPTIAHKFTDNFSVGGSVILAAQQFRLNGVHIFGAAGNCLTSTNLLPAGGGGVGPGCLGGAGDGLSPTALIADGNPNDLSDEGNDRAYGAGVKVGFQWDVNSMFAIGASYQSRIWMSEFDKYSDMFAEQGDFDVPPTATIGVAIKPNDRWTVTFDVQKIWYGDIDSVANPMENLFACLGTGGSDGGYNDNCLGGDDGPGFGWDDMTIYKLGVQYMVNNKWTVRAGYSHGDQPIPDSQVMFNILAPAVMEDHITVGFTYMPSKTSAINFAGMYAPKEEVTGTTAFGDTISLEMYQIDAELSYSWLF